MREAFESDRTPGQRPSGAQAHGLMPAQRQHLISRRPTTVTMRRARRTHPRQRQQRGKVALPSLPPRSGPQLPRIPWSAARTPKAAAPPQLGKSFQGRPDGQRPSRQPVERPSSLLWDPHKEDPVGTAPVLTPKAPHAPTRARGQHASHTVARANSVPARGPATMCPVVTWRTISKVSIRSASVRPEMPTGAHTRESRHSPADTPRRPSGTLHPPQEDPRSMPPTTPASGIQ